MDKLEIFTKVAHAIREEKWLRIKTINVLHTGGKIYTVEETLEIFPMVQDNDTVYGFSRDGGSGTSIKKDVIVEIEELQ